jgi:hypothetical protein
LKSLSSIKMAVHVTNIWFVFSLNEGDILNCCICTTNKDAAVDHLVSLIENDKTHSTWYKLIHYETDGVFYPGDNIYVVLKLDDECRIEIICVKDQYETIDEQIRNNEYDYWIEDMDLS